MYQVCITGSDGFIGQHLTRKLLDKKYKVRTISKTCTNTEFYSPDEVDCKYADIRYKDQLNGILNGVNTVYHLAAIPRNDLNMAWDDFYEVNIKGTKNVLEEATRAGVKKFVFISTVEAAGFGNGDTARTEKDIPNPINNYGKSKLEAEKIVSSDWPMDCTILRLPMIYGPGTYLIVPKLFGMVRKGFYPLIGSGKTKMEFCFVDNAIEAIILAGERKESSSELFYVSDCRSYSIREVVTNIANAMNRKVRFITIPIWLAYTIGFFWELAAKIFPIPPIISKVSRKPFFTRETVYWTTRDVNIVSTDKIREVLGYSPKVGIEEGCLQTANWLNAKLWNNESKKAK